MRKITIKDIDYLVPGTWDEMTAEQLCFLANILNSKSTAQEAKVKMLLFCLSRESGDTRKPMEPVTPFPFPKIVYGSRPSNWRR